MALQFTPIAFGIMLIVAVGTIAYTVWNMNSTSQSRQSYGRPPVTGFKYDCGYDTKEEVITDGQRKKKRRTPEMCSICLDTMKYNNVKELSCKHIFHEKCITVWLQDNNTCPICRTNSSSSSTL